MRVKYNADTQIVFQIGDPIVNRTVAKAEYIAEVVAKMYPAAKCSVAPFADAELARLAPGAGLRVQCTTLGPMLHGEDFESLDFVDLLPAGAVAADVLYPATTILKRAAGRGLRIVDGTGMMYYQQFAAMEFRFGVKLPPEAVLEMEEALDLAITMRNLRNKRKAAREGK